MKVAVWLSIAVLLLAAGPVVALISGEVKLGRDWRTADRSPAGIAPNAAHTPEAIVQVYSARAFNWRGIFGVHTWIATKRQRASHYEVHQVVGWRKWRNLPVVVSSIDSPDRNWYGARPEVISELRGEAAENIITDIVEAVADYPYANDYTVWPGPNSNTFTAYIARRVPELGLELPTTAIGKDYLPLGSFIARAPSGTGYQVSIAGIAGLILARKEGLELNLLGLSLGIDPLGLAIKLPGIGRLSLLR